MSILDVAVTNSTKITKWPSLPDSARVYALNDGARIFHINPLAVGQNRGCAHRPSSLAANAFTD